MLLNGIMLWLYNADHGLLVAVNTTMHIIQYWNETGRTPKTP